MDLLALIVRQTSQIFGGRLASWLERRQALPWASTRKLSQRLNEVVSKASAGDASNVRVMAHLCEQIPGTKLSQVEAYVRGAIEPTIEELRQICAALGASFEFVWKDEGAPFDVRPDPYPTVDEYLRLVRGEEVEEIYFVRGDALPHSSFIALRLDEYRYAVLPQLWHVSRINGNGGANALVELTQLIERLQKLRRSSGVMRGLSVPESVASAVFDGRLHPRALTGSKCRSNHWWDDLGDVDHKRSCAKDYASLYDDEFFAAQKLIKWTRAENMAEDGQRL